MSSIYLTEFCDASVTSSRVDTISALANIRDIACCPHAGEGKISGMAQNRLRTGVERFKNEKMASDTYRYQRPSLARYRATRTVYGSKCHLSTSPEAHSGQSWLNQSSRS